MLGSNSGNSVGVSCERIFKIKAAEGYRPSSEGELSLGFIGFKRTQAFYVLAQYPDLQAYFVRCVLCSFVAEVKQGR